MKQNAITNVRSIAMGKILFSDMEYFKISTPYVTGNKYDRGRIIAGNAATGINNPHKKIMGKR